MDEATPKGWTTEYYIDERGRSTFATWFERELTPYEQAVLTAAIKNVLEILGLDVCSGEWGKPLGGGLYEFRVRQSLHAIRNFGQSADSPALPGEDRTVLLRVFVTFHGPRLILLLNGFNKKRDPSARRQQREIRRARRLLADWRSNRATP